MALIAVIFFIRTFSLKINFSASLKSFWCKNSRDQLPEEDGKDFHGTEDFGLPFHQGHFLNVKQEDSFWEEKVFAGVHICIYGLHNLEKHGEEIF